MCQNGRMSRKTPTLCSLRGCTTVVEFAGFESLNNPQEVCLRHLASCKKTRFYIKKQTGVSKISSNLSVGSMNYSLCVFTYYIIYTSLVTENYNFKTLTIPEKPTNKNIQITYYKKTYKINVQIE